jgi:hypothetical protein
MRRADSARVFTIINQCKKDIWPAVTPGESFGGGGFALRPGQSIVFTAPVGWSGRVWGRTGCDFDPAGNGTCETGACGSSLQCASSSGATPASLAEFTLASVDYYDVSLVDGFNVPMVISPQAVGGGQCPALGCAVDLNCDCPPDQRAAEGAACRGTPAYFKNRCPLTRTTPTDVEPVPQSCRAPGELKIVLCQTSMIQHGAGEADMVIRTVVADN